MTLIGRDRATGDTERTGDRETKNSPQIYADDRRSEKSRVIVIEETRRRGGKRMIGESKMHFVPNRRSELETRIEQAVSEQRWSIIPA